MMFNFDKKNEWKMQMNPTNVSVFDKKKIQIQINSK